MLCCLTSFSALSQQQSAPELPPKPQPARDEPTPPATQPSEDEVLDELTWYDTMHGDISESVVDAANWFDDFFYDDLSKDGDATAVTRFRLGWEPRNGDLSEFSFRFRMKVRLPNLEHKLDLIFADVNEEDINNLPLEGEKTASDASNNVGVAIRVVHQDNNKRFFDSRLGIGSGTVFARTRSRRRFVLSERTALRVEPSVTYFADDGWQVKGLLEAEFRATDESLWRLSTSAWVEQHHDGYQWKHGLVYLHQVNEHAALITGAIVKGEDDNGYRVDDSRFSSRWRQQTHRKWLFYEIEPFFEWNRDNGFHRELGVAFRIEGLFGTWDD